MVKKKNCAAPQPAEAEVQAEIQAPEVQASQEEATLTSVQVVTLTSDEPEEMNPNTVAAEAVEHVELEADAEMREEAAMVNDLTQQYLENIGAIEEDDDEVQVVSITAAGSTGSAGSQPIFNTPPPNRDSTTRRPIQVQFNSF